MKILQQLLPLLEVNRRYALITDTCVAKLYGEGLCQALRDRGYDVTLIVFPAGEAHKTRSTKEAIEDAMMRAQMDRQTTVLALGGGVVTDIAGFVAATYCRGIGLINIPTTVMGMVDAAIGGKTAVNTPCGKNLIGAYYPADHIVIEESFLETLPAEEIRNGYAEIVKYALIASSALFEQLERDETSGHVAICRQIKEEVVKQDPLDKGIRRILNFGHTFAHAYEQALEYRIGHGTAVALGVCFEAYLSWKLGYLSEQELKRIPCLLQHYPRHPVAYDALFETMQMDKKAADRTIRFVLLQDIGSVVPFEGAYCTGVDSRYIKEAYDYLFHSSL